MNMNETLSTDLTGSAETISQINKELENAHPREVLALAFQRYEHVAISFSGAEDVVLLDMAAKLDLVGSRIQAFCLDTGRLHPETYRFIEHVRERYGLSVELFSPDHAAVEAMVKEKGLFSFYREGHQECCSLRKIEPLRRALSGLDAWITGQRRDQSPTRVNVPLVQVDTAFRGRRGPQLVKFNPLSAWSSAQVWEYIRMFDVPYNSLHDRGYISIGCEPCTRAVGPNQHEREGRWWWEESTRKECGLHRSDDQPEDQRVAALQ